MSSPVELEGARDFQYGLAQLRNPYPPGTPAHNEYERGWTQALKRSSASGSPSSHSFAREPGTPQFGVTFTSHEPPVDPDEEKKRAAREYAKATGR